MSKKFPIIAITGSSGAGTSPVRESFQHIFVRDNKVRGYKKDAVVQTILNRMPDYIDYICPQFSRTHINFQRVPMVDTSNPFIARDFPSADESFVVIRFNDPTGVDFPYLIKNAEWFNDDQTEYDYSAWRENGLGHAIYIHPFNS
jgi:phosphoribulokinase